MFRTILSYNESPFSSLYYGGLSHDDLIRFTKHMIDAYPAIKKRIYAKYQHIFIDEYQDTTSDVLNIFYDCIMGTSTNLYLFGDRMQQIYKNYDGSFEERFALFDTSLALRINHRSIFEIVNLLNKIYNDKDYEQMPSEPLKNIHGNFLPRIIICDDIDSAISKVKAEKPNVLVLYLLNKERFTDIGAKNLYQAFSDMDKYSFEKSYSAVDVLTTEYKDNPDPLIKLLYMIANIHMDYLKSQYGLIIQKLRTYKAIFNVSDWHIASHDDKKNLHDNLQRVFSLLTNKEKTIGDLLAELKSTTLIQPAYLTGIFEDEEYYSVFNILTDEVSAITKYLSDPKTSTQHGVKGESHDSVVFVADDSNRNPVVHMYRFFEMWGHLDISLNDFQQFYYKYARELYDLQNTIGMKINDLKAASYKEHEGVIIEKAKLICRQFKLNRFFTFLCADEYDRFWDTPNVTKAKACFKETTVYGVLSAYKLFYVGCSRARKDLTIIIDRSKIKGDIEIQKEKFKKLGFKMC